MAIELKIPTVGESITEVQIGEWLKAEGDAVKQDEPLAVIDSEKTTFDLPAPQSGRLTKILVAAGETVPVGTVVAHLDGDGDAPASGAATALAASAAAPAAKPSTEAAKPAPAAKPAASQPAKSKSNDGEKENAKPAPAKKDANSTPAAEAKANRAPEPSKPAAAPAAPAPKPQPAGSREEEVVPMTMLRRTAAHRLVEARNTMAMLTTFNEVDMSAVQGLRKEYQEAFEKKYQVRLGLMSFFVKAAVDALRQFPQLNAEVRGTDIVYRNYFDIGVAVASERGLVVPVLRNAEGLTFAELEKTIGDFAVRARDGRLKPDDLVGGTFTITNGGVFGSLLSTPIINPPQSGILGLHSIQERPIAVDGQVVIRPMMYMALTYDHRIVDGREAVQFLRRIKHAIEAPVRMLVEI
jgi:2-oxoglutarate dehydrogenase E2 component (dihydrolipoamide succinyltransferase)